MDTETIRNIFNEVNERTGNSIGDEIERQIRREIARINKDSERHMYINENGISFTPTRPEPILRAWHAGDNFQDERNRNIIETLKEQLMEGVNVLNKTKDKEKEEEEEIKSNKELDIMISRIEEAIPELKDMKDEISYENVSCVVRRFEYKLTYLRMFKKIEGFEYELGLLFIFNNRLNIKNFLLDYAHSYDRNNISLYLNKFYNRDIGNKKNKPVMIPRKVINNKFLKENELPKGYLLDIEKTMNLLRNGIIQNDIKLLIGIEKETFNKKMMQWEGKQLTKGKKYEVQRYMTFSLEYFKSKIGITEISSQIFNDNESQKIRHYRKIQDIIVGTPINATNLEENMRDKFDSIIHISSDKAHFLTSAKNIEIIDEKDNYYILSIEVPQLSLDTDMIDLNHHYLNTLHKFNCIQDNIIEVPNLPKIE